MKRLGQLWREMLLLALLLVPVAVLPLLGFWWLVERGLALWWLGGLLAVTAAALGVRRFWAAQPHGIAAPPAPPGAAQAEAAAHAALDAVLAGVTGADIETTDGLRRLAERSLRAVAEAFHPGDPHAALRVTVPEVLLMTEDFAHSLRLQLLAEVPLLQRAELTLIPQGLSLAEGGGRLWDAWRLLRLADPLSAVLQEARAALLNAAITRLTEAGKARLAALVAREIGTAAIALYAGRYRRAAADLAATAPETVAETAPGPVTVLLAGQVNSGKSSLVNALSGRARTVTSLTRETPGFAAWDLDGLVLVDGPGLGETPSPAWLAEAAKADLILWVVRAHDIARGPDQRALAALRARTAADPTLRPTPIVLALTHADRLPPPREWAPPYEPGGTRPKEQSLRAALGAARAALDLPVAVAVRCDTPETAWNIGGLQAALAATLPEARRKQLERAMAPEGWGALARQTARGLPKLGRRLGRLASGVLFPRR